MIRLRSFLTAWMLVATMACGGGSRPSPGPSPTPSPTPSESPSPTPSPTPSPVPRGLLVGYYYENSVQYGRHFAEVQDIVNLYLGYEVDNTNSRTVPPGVRVYVALNIGWPDASRTAEATIADAIKYLRPVWGRIAAIELADEPNWSIPEINGNAAKVKAAVKAAGLASKPIGATFTGKDVLNGTRWSASGLDWLGIEAYLDYIAGENEARTQARMRSHINAQLTRIGTGKRVVLVGMAYDRNGTWKDYVTLVAAQAPVFEAACSLGDRLLALTLFSYARPGGVRDYVQRGMPQLFKEHKRLVAQGCPI